MYMCHYIYTRAISLVNIPKSQLYIDFTNICVSVYIYICIHIHIYSSDIAGKSKVSSRVFLNRYTELVMTSYVYLISSILLFKATPYALFGYLLGF